MNDGQSLAPARRMTDIQLLMTRITDDGSGGATDGGLGGATGSASDVGSIPTNAVCFTVVR